MSAFDEFDVCRNILESLLTGLCVVDMQKRIVFWSEGAEHITGRLRHEVIGRSCVQEPLLHCQQSGCEFCREECPIGRAIKTAHAVEASGFLHHKTGYEVPVRIRAFPVHNPHGSIIGAVETFDELEQSDAQSREKVLAGCFDDVTGLISRAQMNSHLREALASFSERNVAVSVLRFRVEGLERFRAAFGPDAASSLLRVIAHSLTSDLWRTDIVGRWANDEFLVILNGCNGESLPGVRERLRRMLANDAIEWWGERRSLRISIGEATAQPGDTIESTLDRAQKSLDTASQWLSHATAAGKNESSGS
jgi:diguanylate cyclase (GGDEF)-like protein/PAS domain S-box-containing protein